MIFICVYTVTMAELYTIITEEQDTQDLDFTPDDTLAFILGKIDEEISED